MYVNILTKELNLAVFGITDENQHDEILRYQMGRYNK